MAKDTTVGHGFSEPKKPDLPIDPADTTGEIRRLWKGGEHIKAAQMAHRMKLSEKDRDALLAELPQLRETMTNFPAEAPTK